MCVCVCVCVCVWIAVDNSGMFAADECFAGRMLSRGTELCTVVEQLHSLRMSFNSIGDPHFLDKAERIVFNALPGTLDPTQWNHQYLQQANEINALYNRDDRDHVWKSDHGDATGFGESAPICV
eukprot:COSAG06_NODE_1448_length_9438_cov_6.747296_5_plen_124_part_00